MRLFHEGGPDPANIGNPAEFTVGQLAELILRLTGSGSVVEYKELPIDDPRVRCPDITKAREELGWEPRVPLEEGLTRTIEHFKASMNL